MITVEPPAGPCLDGQATARLEPDSTDMPRTLRSHRREDGWRLAGRTITARCSDYASGRISQPIALGLVGPLVILSLGVAVALGVAAFPASYDFRRQWVSALASPQDNPSGYVYFGAGLAVVALLLMPMCGYLAERLRRPGQFCAGVPLFWIGVSGLLLLGLVTAFLPAVGSRRSVHHLFTIMTFFGLTSGFLYFGVLSAGHMWTTRWSGWLAWPSCAVLIIPVLGSATTRLVLDFGVTVLGWGSVQQAREQAPFFLRMAFWEWAAVASLWVGGYLTLWAASLIRSAEGLPVAESLRARAGERARAEEAPLTAGRLYSTAPTTD